MSSPSRGQRLRTRLGNLLLILGAVLLAVPLGVHLYDGWAFRAQMARAAQPSPLMLPPPGGPESAPDGDFGSASPSDAAPPEEGSSRIPLPTPGQGEPAPAYQISIPRIGVTYPVGEGVDDPVLARGPGHYPQTALPGEPGNAAMAGHRTIRGRPAFFYRLDELEPGDEIRIDFPDRRLVFAVERIFLTSPYDLSVLDPTEHPSLTLTTCDPPGSDEMRLIVRSRLIREERT